MSEPAVVLREAVRADASAIASLLRDAFQEFEGLYTAEGFLATAQPKAGVLTRIEQGPVWVAELGPTLIGTISAVRGPDSILLRGMAVHPSARGLGVGRMLLERAEHFAQRHGAQRTHLYTTAFLTQAIRLYRASGYEFTGEAERPHGVELLRMLKDLRVS